METRGLSSLPGPAHTQPSYIPPKSCPGAAEDSQLPEAHATVLAPTTCAFQVLHRLTLSAVGEFIHRSTDIYYALDKCQAFDWGAEFSRGQLRLILLFFFFLSWI